MTDPDRSLVRKARRGDRRALGELYDRHHRKLLGYLVRSVGDRRAAEDVFQEAWIKVLNGIDKYREDRGSFRVWLFRVATNAAVDRFRREGAWDSALELDAPVEEGGERRVDSIESPAPGPGREGEARLTVERVLRELGNLPPRQRAAILLRHQQGLSYAEVGAALAVPEGTAKTLVHRGVAALRRRLPEWDA